MAAVASKNPFDLLGNDIEDENDTPKPPMKEIVKKTTTSKKADVAPPKAVAPAADSRGPRRPRGEGNEGAFRDRGAGRENNRSRPTDQQGGPRERGGRGGRSGRGGRGGREFERHSGTGRLDTDKQVSQGWGNNKSEWTEEQAGESIAQAEAAGEAPTAAAVEGEQPEATEAAEPVAEPEPEDNTKSFAQYQAELESRAPIEELPEARRANEGVREDKKWASAKELVKDEDEEYFVGGKSKQKKIKNRNEKAVVEIDHGFVDPRSLRRGSGDRGGRGARGGARGGDRPHRGGPGRGEFRGGRGGARGLNVSDESAFPSLGK
ncbi:uncharacterized protein DFL_008509 [Arthrobotrys flagrans]|uniref:Hyaluronan/mRNA-binding protein domain-containing protein n=1 Tax=Arthrobotrys flagrans TaxID=97331 RepID=A0A436ZP02_ARTFL|nr:hypothetical protein DFL_008509 [Arthrobotrys flagrans]